MEETPKAWPRVTDKVPFDGDEKTVGEWARTLNMNPLTLISRLGRGWGTEEALTTPCEKVIAPRTFREGPITERVRLQDVLVHDGISKTCEEWAQALGVTAKTLRARLTKYPLATALALSRYEHGAPPSARKAAASPTVTGSRKPPPAVSTPGSPFSRFATLTHDGQTKTVKEWAATTGIPVNVLIQRRHSGWPDSRIVTESVSGVFGRPRKGSSPSPPPAPKPPAPKPAPKAEVPTTPAPASFAKAILTQAPNTLDAVRVLAIACGLSVTEVAKNTIFVTVKG